MKKRDSNKQQKDLKTAETVPKSEENFPSKYRDKRRRCIHEIRSQKKKENLKIGN